jgi:hypothetical protein
MNTEHELPAYMNTDHGHPAYMNTDHGHPTYMNTDHGHPAYMNTDHGHPTYMNTDHGHPAYMSNSQDDSETIADAASSSSADITDRALRIVELEHEKKSVKEVRTFLLLRTIKLFILCGFH